jgi:hypothetical protein
VKKTRQNKRLEPRSDSIGTGLELPWFACLPVHRVNTDIATSARPLSLTHAKRASAATVPKVRDVHDCDRETRGQADLRMSALRARGDARSRGEVEAELALVSDGVFVRPPSERNRPFRVDRHGRGYRKTYRAGSCRVVDQHRGVDRVFQRRICGTVTPFRSD